jgi:hypothetical protein
MSTIIRGRAAAAVAAGLVLLAVPSLLLANSATRAVGSAVATSQVDSARLAVLLSNYPPPNDTNTTADVDNLRWKALSFAMPAGTSANLGQLTVRLGGYSLVTDVPIFEIREHTGSTTLPGTNVLASFTAPPPGPDTAIRDYTFFPSSVFTLQPGTSYWLVLRGPNATSSIDWRGASPAIQPTGIATYGGQSLFSTNGGTSWTNSATINSFELLDIVPEPATGGLVIVLAVAGTMIRRRG